ncbi:MAG: hypothetical protein IKC69_01220 [Clostridia bacterium]|nr:hypothetical protein [Clostridia bacterium]
MKHRLTALFLALLFLPSCAEAREAKNANELRRTVAENRDLLLACVREMEAFGEERIYVAVEYLEEEQENGESLNETETAEKPPREKKLVSFTKETDDRVEIESETLRRAIDEIGLELIFYQTAADSRRTVIFSFTREKHDGTQTGFYYSFDDQPSGWWGRVAKLEKKDNRYLQASENGDAWYYTLRLEPSFFYYEKEGSLLA